MTKATKPAPKPIKPAQAGKSVATGPVTQLLIRARQRIVNPVNWSRGAYARDANNDPVDVLATTAVCWCASGALERECGVSCPTWRSKDDPIVEVKPVPLHHNQLARAALGRAAARIEGVVRMEGAIYSITAINDGLGHEATIKMYNLAISATAKKGE